MKHVLDFLFLLLLSMVIAAPTAATFPVALGGAEDQEVVDMVTDLSGAIYVAGTFTGTIDANGSAIASSGASDVFVAKIDAAGELVWIQTGGGTGIDQAKALALDPLGNLYVSGVYAADAMFHGSPVVMLTESGDNKGDIFLVKYDGADGALLWGARIAGSGADEVGGLVSVPGDLVLLGGSYQCDVRFYDRDGSESSAAGSLGASSGCGTFLDGRRLPVVARIDGDGFWQFRFRRFSTTDTDPEDPVGASIDGLVMNAQNEVYAYGHMRDEVEFDLATGTETFQARESGGLGVFDSEFWNRSTTRIAAGNGSARSGRNSGTDELTRTITTVPFPIGADDIVQVEWQQSHTFLNEDSCGNLGGEGAFSSTPDPKGTTRNWTRLDATFFTDGAPGSTANGPGWCGKNPSEPGFDFVSTREIQGSELGANGEVSFRWRYTWPDRSGNEAGWWVDEIVIRKNGAVIANYRFDSGRPAINQGDFIAKLNGSLDRWEWAVRVPDKSVLRHVTVDRDGHLITVGDKDPSDGSLFFLQDGDVSLPATDGAFIARLQRDNALWQWARSTVGGEGRAAHSDADGSIYLTGAFSGEFRREPGAPALQSEGAQDIFVARLDTDGQWFPGGPGSPWGDGRSAVQTEGSGSATASTIRGDGSGQLYVGGSFSGEALFGPAINGRLNATGGQDAVIANLDTDGQFFEIPTADVELLALTESQDPVAAGGIVTLTAEIRNNGPEPTSGVVVTTTKAASAAFGQAAGCDVVNIAGDQHQCTLSGGLAVGATRTFSLEIMTPTGDGTLSTTAMVASHAITEEDASNDAQTITTRFDGLDPTLAVTAPSSSFGTVGDFIDLRGTANDASGVTDVCWDTQCRSVRATGADGSANVDWIFRRLPIAAGQDQTVELKATDRAGRTASETVQVTSRRPEEILTSLTFDGQAVDIETGDVLANPVAVTVDPVLDVEEIQLFLNGLLVGSGAGPTLTANVDVAAYPQASLAKQNGEAEYHLQVAVRLTGGRVVADPRRIPVAIASGVEPAEEDGTLWDVRPKLEGLVNGPFRDLTADGRWAVTATDLRGAVRNSEEVVDGNLHYLRQEVGRSTSRLLHFEGKAWTPFAPQDLVDPQGLLCTSTPQLPCLIFTAVLIDGDTLWIGTDRGLVQATTSLPPTVEAVYNADSPSGPAASWITDIHRAADGNLWVTHRASRWHTLQPNASKRFWHHFGGVSRLSGTSWTSFRAQHAADGSTDTGGAWESVAGLRPTRVTTTESGTVWVASEVGLSIFENGAWRHENRATTGLPFDDVQALAVAEVRVSVDPPPATPGGVDPPAFLQDQVWAWAGGPEGLAFLRLTPPAAADGTPQPGSPSREGTWAQFTQSGTPLSSDRIHDVALCCTDDPRPLVWLATDEGVFSLDPAGLAWVHHEQPGLGRAGALARDGDAPMWAAVALDDPAEDGRVARVDTSLGLTLQSPANGARIATDLGGTAEITLAWEAVPGATAYEVFLDGQVAGRTAASTHTLRLPAGEVQWSVRALYDQSRRALARALPHRLEILDGTGPIEFLTLENGNAHVFRSAEDGAIENRFDFLPFSDATAYHDLAAEVTGAVASAGTDGMIAVHPAAPAPAVEAGTWRADSTSETGGLVFGDLASERVRLYEAAFGTLTDAPSVAGLRDVAGLAGGSFAVLADGTGGDAVRRFERVNAFADIVELDAVPLGLDALALTGLPGAGFAVLTSTEVQIYDEDASSALRLAARLALPDDLGTARDLAVDEKGRLFVLFDGPADAVAFSHDLGLRSDAAPTLTTSPWTTVATGGDFSAIATFATLAGRSQAPSRDYDPPSDPPPGAGANSGTAGPFTVRTDGGPIDGASWSVASGTHFLDYFLRATGALSFDGARLSGDVLFLDLGDGYPEFTRLLGAGGVRIAEGWTLDVTSGRISGEVDLSVPGLGAVGVEELQVLGLAELAGSTSRSGVRLGGQFASGPGGLDTRFESLFLADFGGTFHATFGGTGLDGLKPPFDKGYLTFVEEAGGGGVPVLIEVDGGLDLSENEVPPVRFSLATADICPSAPTDFDCGELLEVVVENLEVGDGTVRFDSALGRVLNSFTLEILGGEFLSDGDAFGLGTGDDGDGARLTMPFAEPLTFPGFFVGTAGLRFDGDVPISFGRFDLEMSGLELRFNGDEANGFFSLEELDLKLETGSSGREFNVHMGDLEVPFATFSGDAFPVAKQVLVRLRETCDDDEFDDCGCNPCADDFESCQEKDSNNSGSVTTYDKKEFFKIQLCEADGFRFTDTEIAIPAFELIVPNPGAKPAADNDTLSFRFGGGRLTPDFIELTDPSPVTLFGTEVDFDLTRLGKDGFFTEKAVIKVAGKSSGGDDGEDPSLQITLRDFELGIDTESTPPVRLGLSGGGFERYGFGVDVARSDFEEAICSKFPHGYGPRDPVFEVSMKGIPVIGEVGGTVLIDDERSSFLEILCLDPPSRVKLGPLEITDLNFGNVPDPPPAWALDSGGDLKWLDPAFFGGRIRFGELPEIAAYAVLDDGTLDLLRAEVAFDAPGRHLFQGVFLQGVRAQYQISRSEFLGGATFSAGPQIELPFLIDDPIFLAHLDGEIVISGMGFVKASAGLRLLRAEGIFSGFPVAKAELILGKVYRRGVFKGTGVYFAGNVKLFFGMLDVSAKAWTYVDNKTFGGDFDGKFRVPRQIPIIGGYSFGRVNVAMNGGYDPLFLEFRGKVRIKLLFVRVGVGWRVNQRGFRITKDQGLTRSASLGFHKGYHDDTGLSVLTDFELLNAQEVKIGGLAKDSRVLEFTVDRDAPAAIVRVDFSRLEGNADLIVEFPDGRSFTANNTPALFPPDPNAPEPQEGDLPIGYRKEIFEGAPEVPGDPNADPPILPQQAAPPLKEAAFVFAGPLALQEVEVEGPDGQPTGETLETLLPTAVPQGTYRVTVVTDGMNDAGDALVEFLLDDNPPELNDASVDEVGANRLDVAWQVSDLDGDDVTVRVHFSTDRDSPTDGFEANPEDGFVVPGGLGGSNVTVDLCAPDITGRNITALLHLFLSIDDGREDPIYYYLDSFLPCLPADAPPQIENVVTVARDGSAEVYWDPLTWDAPEGLELTSYGVTALEIGSEGTRSDLPISVAVPLAGRGSTEVPSGWVINEIHAEVDPVIGDANGDGVSNASDRFVEIVNDSGSDQNLEGWGVTVGSTSFAFPAGTIVPDQCATVLFSGDSPEGAFGNAGLVGNTGLDLGAGTAVDFRSSGGQLIASAAAGAASEPQSRTRVPDIHGASFADHSQIASSGGLAFSPGTRADGRGFVGCGGRGQATLNDLTPGREYSIAVTPIASKQVEVVCIAGQEVPPGDICHPDAFPPPPILDPDCTDDPETAENECLVSPSPRYGEPFTIVEELAGKPSVPVRVLIPGEARNRWPQIVSTPLATAVEIGQGNVWTYLLKAVDEDGDALILDLESGDVTIDAPALPEGLLEISPALGVPNPSGTWTLVFTPGTHPDMIDRYPLRLTVTDGRTEIRTMPVVDPDLGTVENVEKTLRAEATQDLVLEVVHFDQAPAEGRITSEAPRFASVGRAYLYDAEVAATPESLKPRFFLRKAPAGMTVDSATGLVVWTPGAELAGSRHVVILELFDPTPGCEPCTLDTEAFELQVIAPAVPPVADQPRLVASPALVFADNEGGVVTVQLRNLGSPGTALDWQAQVVDDPGQMLAFEPNGGDVLTGSGDAALAVSVAFNPENSQRTAKILVTATNPAGGPMVLDSPTLIVFEQSADSKPPTVAQIEVGGDEGDAVLTPCDTARTVAQLRVVFSESMRHSDGLPGDAASPPNYRLVTVGSDADLETESCSALEGDDELVALQAVRYRAKTRDAVLELEDVPLADGLYRLLVCGTVEDRVGNPLASGDFSLTFRVDRFNLFENAHLDVCQEPPLGSWSLVEIPPSQIVRDDLDVDGASQSGSVRILGAGPEVSVLGQCLSVNGNASYELNARVRYTPINGTQAIYSQSCEFFATSDCSENALGQSDTSVLADAHLDPQGGTAPSVLEIDSWPIIESRFTTPRDAASALCSFAIKPLNERHVDFELHLDQLFLGPVDTTIFMDSFESGGLGHWSLHQP